MDRKLLVVDLTHGEITEQAIDPAYARDFIGGSGLGVRLLWDSLDPKRDPLDPASPLLWMTGPLTGTGGPTTGRSSICARSPQTGLWGESNIGGFVGSELRYAGYDGVLITGRANAPVYLWIHNGQGRTARRLAPVGQNRHPRDSAHRQGGGRRADGARGVHRPGRRTGRAVRFDPVRSRATGRAHRHGRG